MRSILVFCVFAACRVCCAEHVTVEAAVSEALSHNAALLASKADISVADARILTARLRPNPVATLTGDHLDVLGTGFNDINGGGPSEIAFGLEYTLQRGGKRAARIAVARDARAVTELEFRDAVRELSSRFRTRS